MDAAEKANRLKEMLSQIAPRASSQSPNLHAWKRI